MTPDHPVIEIFVNGKVMSVPADISVADLLQHLDIQQRALAVEINRHIQPADGFALRRLEDGDRLELVTLVGGG